MIQYFDVPTVRTSYTQILRMIRWNLAIHQHVHWVDTRTAVDAVGRFDEWWDAHLGVMVGNVQNWAIPLLNAAAARWGTRIDIMENIDALRAITEGLRIDRTGFPVNVYLPNVPPPATF